MSSVLSSPSGCNSTGLLRIHQQLATQLLGEAPNYTLYSSESSSFFWQSPEPYFAQQVTKPKQERRFRSFRLWTVHLPLLPRCWASWQGQVPRATPNKPLPYQATCLPCPSSQGWTLMTWRLKFQVHGHSHMSLSSSRAMCVMCHYEAAKKHMHVLLLTAMSGLWTQQLADSEATL